MRCTKDGVEYVLVTFGLLLEVAVNMEAEHIALGNVKVVGIIPPAINFSTAQVIVQQVGTERDRYIDPAEIGMSVINAEQWMHVPTEGYKEPAREHPVMD